MALDLVTRSEYKTYAGISSTTQDAEISALITKVSAFVKTFCRQSFLDYVDESKVETFNGGGFDTYYLKEYPIISVNSLEYSTNYGQSFTAAVLYTDWVYDPSAIAVRSLWPTGFTNYINGYRVSYNCGYPDGVPEDLKLAVMDLITYYRKNDSAVHTHNNNVNPNTLQTTYISSSNLPAHIQRVLVQYQVDYT
jgi:hypothetical protein